MNKEKRNIVLVVTAVVAVVLLVSAVRLFRSMMEYSRETMVAVAKHDMKMLSIPLNIYKTRNGEYPSNVNILRESIVKDMGEDCAKILLDPWGRKYIYEGHGTNYTIRSLGPDGRQNTIDDIVARAPGPAL